MKQNQENKVDDERLSSEIASAFLERLYRHEVVHCHEGDAPSLHPIMMMIIRPVLVNRLERASYDQSPPVDQLFDWVTGTGES